MTQARRRNSRRKDEKAKDAYDSRIVSIRRTTKVREGGRDFSFSAVAVVGDGKGRVGLGCGKAKEVVLAVKKATEDARKNMKQIPLKGDTIQYRITNSLGATKVIILPGAEGTGIIAGGAMRPVFEVLGVKNVIAKCIGSRNPLNVIRATIDGLVGLCTPAEIAAKRGKSIEHVLGKKEKSIKSDQDLSTQKENKEVSEEE